MSKPTVAIIAATGGTGKWALKGALQREYPVRVLVRSKGKLKRILQELLPEKTEEAVGEMLEKDITVVESPALEQDKLVELFTGADVAMGFLGMGPDKVKVVEPGARKIVDALRSMDSPPKYLHMSSISLNDGAKHGQKAWGCCVVGLALKVFLKACFDDLRAGEDVILSARDQQQAAGYAGKRLNLTMIRATILADKKDYLKDYTSGDKSYKLVKVGDEKTSGKLSFQIDRQHVAEAFLDAARVLDYDGENVSVFEK
jgi:hypothetical protein